MNSCATPRRTNPKKKAVGASPCPDFETLLDLGLDVVVIAVPNVLHAGASLAALERGLHVFCEKPMATSLDDARRVLDTVNGTRRAYQMGFNRRFAPAYTGLRDVVAGGMRVFSGTIKMNDGDMRTPAWFANRAISGGFLYDTGIHLLDTAMWVLGPVAEVRCLARSSCYPDQDDAVALITFESGALLTFSTCGHATWTPPTERVELFGDHAAITTEGFDRLAYTPALGPLPIVQDFSGLPMPERLGYVQEALAFVESVRRDRQTAVTAEDAYRSIELVDGCYRSARAGGEGVRLP